MKLRLLFLAFVAVTGAQLNAGYFCTNRLAEGIVPAGFVVVGIGVAGGDGGATILSGIAGLAFAGLRAYLDGKNKPLEIGLKCAQVAIPAFWAYLWYTQKDAIPDGVSMSLERYKAMANQWFKVDAAVTAAEAAIQICC